MLHYAVVFLVIALIAAVFGFGGIAAGAAGIAKILFVAFLIGALISFLMHSSRRVSHATPQPFEERLRTSRHRRSAEVPHVFRSNSTQ